MLNQRLKILFKKQLEQNTSLEEEKELRELMADPANETSLTELLNESWDGFEPKGKSLSYDEQKSILRSIFKSRELGSINRTKLLYGSTWFKVAAAILIIACFATMYLLQNNMPDRPVIARKMNQVATQPHSKTTLQLADGTQVWLHANSQLVYDNETFGKANRQVTLIGEAYFDVVKNTKVPFIIHTGSVNITVKGTAFNVKAYPKDRTVETTLVRGLIEITTVEDPDRKILLKPNEKIVIPVAEDSLKIAPNNSIPSPYSITRLKPTDEAPAEISWIQNQLVFDNEPFGSIAPKMSSWYNVQVEFSSEEVKQKRFSGTIEHETLIETLQAMQLSFPFSYRIVDNILYIDSK